ncbi:Hypp6887 [Branchiostoma lanceolatum]|uniref:Hypp6887 protein n=1 Tax=Branchiostoma lanceolatum TaxID=7740 RepID=A0A8K0EAS2_BRALA|nr:Hypp6887 [Branchiostoma lanceolatum]
MDGAAVMSTDLNGVTGLLHRDNPYTVAVHCVCLRLHLAASQVTKDNPQMKSTNLRTLNQPKAGRERGLARAEAEAMRTIIQKRAEVFEEGQLVTWLEGEVNRKNPISKAPTSKSKRKNKKDKVETAKKTRKDPQQRLSSMLRKSYSPKPLEVDQMVAVAYNTGLFVGKVQSITEHSEVIINEKKGRTVYATGELREQNRAGTLRSLASDTTHTSESIMEANQLTVLPLPNTPPKSFPEGVGVTKNMRSFLFADGESPTKVSFDTPIDAIQQIGHNPLQQQHKETQTEECLNVEPGTHCFKEPKFMVFFSMLVSLFSLFSFRCKEERPTVTVKMTGTMAIVSQSCTSCDEDSYAWPSQPFVFDKYPTGNILLSFGILISGISLSKTLLLFKHIGLSMFSGRAYHQHQKKYLVPSILCYWKSYRQRLINLLKGEKNAVWSGDGRYDSMGHSAKYGAYTMFCNTINKLVHFELLQSNDCKNSNAMELEGAKRSFAFLTDAGLTGVGNDPLDLTFSNLRSFNSDLANSVQISAALRGIHIVGSTRLKLTKSWEHSMGIEAKCLVFMQAQFNLEMGILKKAKSELLGTIAIMAEAASLNDFDRWPKDRLKAFLKARGLPVTRPIDELQCRSTSMACRMLAVEDAPSQPVRRVYDAVIQGEERVEDAPNFRTVRTQLERRRASLAPPPPPPNYGGCRHPRRVGEDIGRTAVPEPPRQWPGYPPTSSPVIHGLYHGRVIPFVMALMTSKTVGAYRQVLQHIKEKEREETGHDLSPEMIVSDFKGSIISSNETEFPDAITGCYFHFCQSLWRRIQQLSLAGPCRWDPRLRLKRCLRKVMGIGYLPVALVRFNFQEHIGRNSTQQLIGQYPALQEFFDYKETNYVAADDVTFPIPLWNVYNRDTDTKTNNLMPFKSPHNEDATALLMQSVKDSGWSRKTALCECEDRLDPVQGNTGGLIEERDDKQDGPSGQGVDKRSCLEDQPRGGNYRGGHGPVAMKHLTTRTDITILDLLQEADILARVCHMEWFPFVYGINTDVAQPYLVQEFVSCTEGSMRSVSFHHLLSNPSSHPLNPANPGNPGNGLQAPPAPIQHVVQPLNVPIAHVNPPAHNPPQQLPANPAVPLFTTLVKLETVDILEHALQQRPN